LNDSKIIVANHSHAHKLMDQCSKFQLKVEINNSMKSLEQNGFKGKSNSS